MKAFHVENKNSSDKVNIITSNESFSNNNGDSTHFENNKNNRFINKSKPEINNK